jgi:hypothetical protein
VNMQINLAEVWNRIGAYNVRLDGSSRKIYELLLISYLVSTIYFYQFGIVLGKGDAFRIPDFLAVGCILIGVSVLAYRPRLTPTTYSLWPIAPFLALEILLPLIGAIALGRGISGLNNSLRVFFLWAPLVLYITSVTWHGNNPSFHKKIRHVLVASILVNFIYSLIQLLAKSGFLPQYWIVLSYLQPLAIDESFRPIIQGFRAQGFFVNSTALSIFGICCLAYFLGVHFESKKRTDLIFAFFSAALVIMSLSRTGLVSTVLILASYLFLSNARRAFLFLIQFAVITALIFWILHYYVDLNFLFQRIDIFLTLGASGAFEDYSVQTRIYKIWPTILDKLHHYPYGTLVSSSNELGLIDSGYLTLYSQGKWLFVASFLVVIIATSATLFKASISHRNGYQLSLLFLGIFLTGSMVMSNPIRNPFMIFMLIYFFWQAKALAWK